MAKLTYKQRKALPSRAFVFPKSRKYPIHDVSHARNALARGSAQLNRGNLTLTQYNKIVNKVNAKYKMGAKLKTKANILHNPVTKRKK